VSNLFTADLFGSLNPDTGIVEDGRWGFTEIPTLSYFESKSLVTDVYGQLRSPWNVNDRPFMGRGFGKSCGESMAWDTFEKPNCLSHYR
ncbi:unnamed protein product, partial [Choristocarpus tenellus]